MKIGYLMQEGVADIRQTPPSGPALHVIRVIKELTELGHQVVLVARFDEQVYLSEDLITFEPIQIDFLGYAPFRLFEKMVRRMQSILRLPYLNFFESIKFALVCRNKLSDFDIFYERFGWIGYGGWIAARLTNRPIIWELNGDHVTELASHGFVLTGAQKWVSFKLMHIIARRIDHTVAAGDGWMERHIQRWGVSPSKIVVIENGSQVVDMLSRQELRAFQETSADAENIKIVYLGAFETWHGIKALLKAFSLAITSLPYLHLDLIGDGPERNEIIQLVRAFRLESTVNLTGNIGLFEVVRYLKNADIGVSPYCGRVEYSGLKLLDYKSAGLATISSGENGQPLIIKHGQTGLIVPPCDEDALRDAIIYLSKNNFIRKKIGQQARLEAEQLHRWRHTAEQLESLFTRILAG